MILSRTTSWWAVEVEWEVEQAEAVECEGERATMPRCLVVVVAPRGLRGGKSRDRLLGLLLTPQPR